jgi:hypothetical protein
MASGIITTVKLEPFYQQFLKSHFECNELVFSFPKEHDLQSALNLLLTKNPQKNTYLDYGSFTFRIELVYLKTKNIRYNNFISERASSLFASKVRNFYGMIFHEFYSSLYRSFKHKDIVYLWIEKHGFSESSYDRIEREARRYRKRNYDRTYLAKKKLKNVKQSTTSMDVLSSPQN